jgi:mannose/cellobiose epimerase-like protein (N-acyl-D-glucosamine 2-epimerase family)
MSQPRENFATQVTAERLSAMRELSVAEGRQIEALVEDAFTDLVEKRKKANPRPHVMEAYLASHEKYAPLYKKLAE